MKLHDLRPAEGSRRARTRVGRGIAAGKGKTAGRGTKGQKARAGASIPAWFEGGQTPLQIRIPKLRGFRNPFKVHYEVVNLGRIEDAIQRGRIAVETPTGKGKKQAPLTVNQEILMEAGLVRTLKRPLKILGAGEVTRPLFVVADAFTASAAGKIEAAGGTAQVIEIPSEPLAALGLDDAIDAAQAVAEAAPEAVAGSDAAEGVEAAEEAAVDVEVEAAAGASDEEPRTGPEPDEPAEDAPAAADSDD
jgi:large subunit ribosomal protein L15